MINDEQLLTGSVHFRVRNSLGSTQIPDLNMDFFLKFIMHSSLFISPGGVSKFSWTYISESRFIVQMPTPEARSVTVYEFSVDWASAAYSLVSISVGGSALMRQDAIELSNSLFESMKGQWANVKRLRGTPPPKIY
jgi:hypothetical protein